MPLHFQRASSVAVGVFNVYAIQPQWLTARRALPEGLEWVIETKMDEPGFRFRSEGSKARWIVTPTRIVIETDDPHEDCGLTLARALALLPEAPLMAVGNNAYYQAEAAALGEWPPLPDYPATEPLPGFALDRRSFQVGAREEACLHNAHLSVSPERLELVLNAHAAISGGQETLAVDHAKQFLAHRRTGITLARHHLKVTFDD
jgi:hypothetical protein